VLTVVFNVMQLFDELAINYSYNTLTHLVLAVAYVSHVSIELLKRSATNCFMNAAIKREHRCSFIDMNHARSHTRFHVIAKVTR